jgi:basic amino acid/polyamine antiporter, APA family
VTDPGSTRRLGLLSASSLVVANMVGVGAFTTSGFLLADLKSPSLVLAAWIVGGLVALCGALSYGALARAIPESGGEYLYLSRTLHPAAGYLAGWVSLLAGFSAPIAAAGFAFGKYAQVWLPTVPLQVSGSVLLIASAAVHAWRVERGAEIQNAAVVLKLILIAIVVACGFSRLQPGPANALPSEMAWPIGSFAVSLIWISFSYAGWNAAVYVAGEVRDPDRNLPRSLIIGTGIVMLVYVAVNAVMVFGGPGAAIAGQVDAARIVAEGLGGKSWGQAISILIALGLATSISAMLMVGPRVYARMADDGCLPAVFKSTAGPPRAAITLQLLLALGFLWTGTFESLLTYIGFTLNLSAAGAVVGLILVRRRSATAPPMFGWPWAPALFLLFVIWTTWFAFERKTTESLVGLLTLGAGWVAWKLGPGPPGPTRKED